jgi:ribosomal protein S4
MAPENILDRRLQTQVYLQGLASTVKQSRQLIIHGHISVDGAVNRVPGMLVTKNQEKNITYSPSSALNSDLHPVRPGAKASYEDEEIIEEVSSEEEVVEGEASQEEVVEESKEPENTEAESEESKDDEEKEVAK